MLKTDFNLYTGTAVGAAIPEAKSLSITVGKYVFNIGQYELANALLINNSLLNNRRENLAVFHPKDDLLDISLLVFMGLAAYKKNINANSRLRVNDFKNGDLIEYRGNIVKYGGAFTDTDGMEKFRIAYKDRYKTTVTLPLYNFAGVSKYIGPRVEPDPDPSERKKSNRVDINTTAAELLGIKESSVSVGGYPGFLVVSQNPNLFELLKLVKVNRIPFFQIFPSIKHGTTTKRNLGSHGNAVFNFVSSLATADDVLASERGVRHVLVDMNGRPTANVTSLLDAIKYNYEVESIYLLQTYERLADIFFLENDLGFKNWFWGIDDFQEFKALPTNGGSTRDLDDEVSYLLNRHNNLYRIMSCCKERPVLVEYPAGCSAEIHSRINSGLRSVYRQSLADAALSPLWIKAQGITNKIFQSTIPIETRRLQGNNISSQIEKLDEEFRALPFLGHDRSFVEIFDSLIGDIKRAATAFEQVNPKLEAIRKIIIENQRCRILVQTKNAVEDRYVIDSLSGMLKDGDQVVHSPSAAFGNWDVVVWTYRPPLDRAGLLSIGTGENHILLYGLQHDEYQQAVVRNNEAFAIYKSVPYRMAMLGDNSQGLEANKVIRRPSENLVIDLDKIMLSSSLGIGRYDVSPEHSSESVAARKIVFVGGQVIFFRKGRRIKILDTASRSIDQKTVDSLEPGDRVIFIKDSKKTVFEEMVSFYRHKPEVTSLISKSEMWRNSLIRYCAGQSLSVRELRERLAAAGLNRTESSIESWLEGSTISPLGRESSPLEIIASVTKDEALKDNLEEVGRAATAIRSLHINIGKYLASRIIGAPFAGRGINDDPVLRAKLDNMSNLIDIEEVAATDGNDLMMGPKFVDKLFSIEELVGETLWQE